MKITNEMRMAAYQNLADSIAEYDKRLGYLGANWQREVQERESAGQDASFRVYFDLDYCCDIYLEAGRWSCDRYLEYIVEKSLEFSTTHPDIENPIPEYIEITF